ncbi:MAG: LLM class flavin-dependent oxidoreductase [Myxococcota bacterium]|nr:LLM class flavin-dependent oxidoreductase [Myxococcota bacterium]
MSDIPLNILCQSPVSDGMTPSEAIGHTVQLARDAEALGYHRFWVAEHHSDAALASASPEVMVAAIAAQTERIRVGSGGVLLPYYAPFKVAEQFNLLEALFPGRIDLGLGRSGGSERHAPQALGLDPRRMQSSGAFAAIDALLTWLGPGGEGRPHADTFASPSVERGAEPWILGTSPASATYAGERGLPYAFGGFLDPRGLVGALGAYHQAFQPSAWLDRPRVNLAWYVQAAETEEEAHTLSLSSEHWFVETFLRGGNPRFASPDAVVGATYAPMEQMAIAMRRQFALVGTGEQVMEGLMHLQREYRVDELTLVTIAFDPEARRASYRLIAEAT